MNLIIRQATSFKRIVKKLSKQQKEALDAAVRQLVKEPTLGERKKGDLDFLRVLKYKFSNQEYLLGYIYEEQELILTLLKLGVHENFYREIKNLLT